MLRALSLWLTVTDAVFLLYWTASLLVVVGVFHPPPAMMYAGYDQARVVAWNWSFLPLDIAFSVSGLAAVRAARRGAPVWRPLALLSLCLTSVAGGMAVGYWAILREFDPSWFLPNLLLLLWPLPFIRTLIQDLGATGR